jgi:apolipoprotein N-acyltransferase
MEEASQDSRYYNTVYLIAPNGAILDTYDKMRLLPFAEYRPLGVLPTFLPHSSEYPTEFTPGTRSTIFPLGNTAFGVTICYEVTYPTLTRRLAREGARFLVNMSNESWLAQGGVAAPAQHFSMAVFRAVETRRPLARVATFGVTGFVDAVGRIQQTSTAKEGRLIGRVIPRSEQTLYTYYGDWFAITCAVLAGGLLVHAGRRRSR